MTAMNCPKCGTAIPDKLVKSESARLAGSKRGPTKARTSEQARAAVMARWNKRKKLTPAKGEKK